MRETSIAAYRRSDYFRFYNTIAMKACYALFSTMFPGKLVSSISEKCSGTLLFQDFRMFS